MTIAIDDALWHQLIARASAVRERAYAPYSHFPVGVALLAFDDSIHAGANIENVAFPSGQCAEASALGVFVAAGAPTPIRAVVVAGSQSTFTWPCGHCRQKLAELATGDCQVMSVADSRHSARLTMAELLPHAFDSLA